MTDTTDADAFLAPRFGEAWTDLELATKIALLTQASDYILATYTFTIDDPENAPEFKAAKWYLAFQLNKAPLAIAHSDPVSSKEERLEGLASEKTSYAVQNGADPYPLVTNLLGAIIVKKTSFRVARLSK